MTKIGKIMWLALFLLLAVMLTGCDALDVPTTNTAQEPVRTPAPTPEPTPEPPSEFILGETATIGRWEVTLDSVEYTDRIGENILGAYVPQDGNTFLYATITVTNLDTGPRTFLSMFATQADVRTNVVYANEFTFNRTNLLTYRDIEGRTTNALTSTTGGVIFSVANRAVESDGSLVLRFFTNREEVVFVLR